MFIIIGLGVVFGSILVGYMMHGGQIGVLIQINEFIILGGAGLGSMLVANGLPAVLKTLKAVIGLLKGNPYTKDKYTELLKMLYDLFLMARREGMVSLDQHVEHPHESKFFSQYGFFYAHHHATAFLADTLKVVITGSIAPHDLESMMECDLEVMQEEEEHPVHIMQTTGDAMPAFGIVAAVLGIVITMGKIGGDPKEIGHSVGAALVGTFLGILVAYGLFAPISVALAGAVRAQMQYMNCIKSALLSFARGDAPMTCVEYARRNIEPDARPSFSDMETTCKNTQAKAA